VRIRITFAKNEAMRYTGNLDLFRTWERTFRRTGLPLAYSQGFNQRPRIHLAAALPLGFTSQGEVADVWLDATQELQEVAEILSKSMPPGLQVLKLEEVDPQAPSLQTQVISAEFVVTLLEPVTDLEARLQNMILAEGLPRLRRDKVYDLRPLIEDIQQMPADEHGCARLRMRLMAKEGATGRPEEVLEALSIPAETARVCRTCLIFQENA
jgi:radical SAM-linked protein